MVPVTKYAVPDTLEGMVWKTSAGFGGGNAENAGTVGSPFIH